MNSTGFIHHSASWCLAIRVDLGVDYGVTVQPCSRPFSRFEVTSYGQLRSVDANTTRRCLVGRTIAPVDVGGSVEFWVKPLATDNSTIAVLVTNLGANATIPITPADCGAPARSPGFCISGFAVRDVWNRKDVRDVVVRAEQPFNVSLASTDTAFLIFKCRRSTLHGT